MFLSKNKQRFLANTQKEVLVRLSLEDLRPLVKHYFKKYNIKIFIGGDVLHNPSMPDERQCATQEYYKDITHYAQQEITAIQSSLLEEEWVGYLYLMGGHIEAFIISKETIIKPITWHSLRWFQRISAEEIPQLFHGDWLSRQPQSSSSECGTLSLLYLKELLKNNAYQLKEYSLRFVSYSNINDLLRKPTLNYFFFPSPQVLRYSQSSQYNALAVQCLLGKKQENQNEECLTLEDILQTSMAYALEQKDESTYTNNKKLLESLPNFREKWLAEYSSAQIKREAMNNVDNSQNQYLFYRAIKMAKRANDRNAISVKACIIL